MATAEHAITVNEAMELPALPPNQGVEAMKDIVFGSSAGMAGKLIEYPFDTVKTVSASPSAPMASRAYTEAYQPPMTGAAVETSCLFFSYRIIQDALRATVFPGVDHLPFAALLFSGAASGSITSLALTPIELIKCRMQVPTSTSVQPRPLALVAEIFRREGLIGFWRGQLGTLIRETGGSAAWFGGYEGVSSLFRAHNIKTSPDTDGTLFLHQQLIAGATAGISYNFLFYPADTIKSRLQTEDISLRQPGAQRQTFWSVSRALWRQQGFKGMYRGCGITCARSAPSSAFIFSVYEGLRSFFG
ncbi:hypothetical protein N7533_011536 [Penicillium manginii]|uniref:uncharacterized protein n=1 Tax=Penicillium manginii TaxID=203109 RepID=UPI00254877AF|nr:uncharacterized protein N7533_011536 [Penicillium manginii]KAJ5742127.1 hypothetical protein N7533_011536 [Penicillium manginii]